MRHRRFVLLLVLAGIGALVTGFVLRSGGPITHLPESSPARATTVPKSEPDAVAAAGGTTVGRPTGSATATTTTAGRAAAGAAGPVMPPAEPTRLRIPAIGVDSALVELGLRENATLEVPPGGDRAGWFSGGTVPGTIGPAVIVGHVDWEGTAGVFARLAALRPGDRIVVRRADGSAAVFEVNRLEQHPKNRFPTREVYGPTDRAALRLITCGGEFDESRGDYRDNIIVYARLVRAQR